MIVKYFIDLVHYRESTIKFLCALNKLILNLNNLPNLFLSFSKRRKLLLNFVTKKFLISVDVVDVFSNPLDKALVLLQVSDWFGESISSERIRQGLGNHDLQNSRFTRIDEGS